MNYLNLNFNQDLKTGITLLKQLKVEKKRTPPPEIDENKIFVKSNKKNKIVKKKKVEKKRNVVVKNNYSSLDSFSSLSSFLSGSTAPAPSVAGVGGANTLEN